MANQQPTPREEPQKLVPSTVSESVVMGLHTATLCPNHPVDGIRWSEHYEVETGGYDENGVKASTWRVYKGAMDVVFRMRFLADKLEHDATLLGVWDGD